MDVDEDIILLGKYVHAIDGQRRIAVPREWRGKDGETRFYLMPGRNGALQLMPEASFRELLGKLRKVSFANAEAANAMASLGANSKECRCDKSGRIQLPEELLEHAGIKRGGEVAPELVMVGAVTTIQIWSTGNWAKQDISSERTLDAIQRIQEAPEGLETLLKGGGKL